MSDLVQARDFSSDRLLSLNDVMFTNATSCSISCHQKANSCQLVSLAFKAC